MARRAQCCALAAPFSLRASGRFIAAALGATGVSDADYDKALSSERAQEILKAWGDNYDVAKIQGVPALVVGKYLLCV